MTVLKISAAGLATLALLAGAQAHAQGVITFQSDAPAVGAAVQATQAGRAQAAKPPAQMPGINRVEMPPVSPEDSEAAIRAHPVPANLNPGVQPRAAQASTPAQRVAGDAAPAAPASVAELARALRHDVDLIYEHVRNNVEYVPLWGVKKGAFGAILDNQGTAFDQAALMVELLRQSGYTANYVKGRINLTAAQVTDWLGMNTAKVCTVLNLLGNGRIPVSGIVATAAGSCPGSGAALVSLKVDHVWVKVNIGGTNYYFDPSYKPHTRKVGINLATATGYNAASYLSAATSGATSTADYIQNPNRTNIRSNLTSYAGNLASWLRTNKPAGTLDDAVGGMTINPHIGGNLRQATLPYQDTSAALTAANR